MDKEKEEQEELIMDIIINLLLENYIKNLEPENILNDIRVDEDSIKWGMKIAYDLIDSNIQTYLIKDENIKKGD